MKNYIKKLVAKEELSFDEIHDIVCKIANKEATDAQIAAFIVAITEKGVSKDEFFALASSMREFSYRVKLDEYVVDSCGTGADMSGTINISTASAIVANACGAKVLKQTNSSITSKCGSSDFLSAMNIDILRTPEDAKKEFEEKGIAFVHSPYFNGFANVNNPIRQQIGIKSVFNFLGPLINPAFPDAQLLGVSSIEMCEKIVYALKKLGTKRALVVNGLKPNMDEISICSKTAVWELKDGNITNYEISPEDFGFNTVSVEEIKGGNSAENAQIIKDIYDGKINDAKRNVICMNAGAMLYLAGIAKNMFDGARIAQNTIESGKVSQNLLKIQGVGVKC